MTSAPIHVAYSIAVLGSREERGGDRREDGELADDGRPLQRDRDRVEGPGRGQVRTDSVITVPTEIADGIATDSPAAATAHQAETSRRARRYTGTAVRAKHNAFANLNQSYAASTLPARRMITASISREERAEAEGLTAEREAVARDQR